MKSHIEIERKFLLSSMPAMPGPLAAAAEVWEIEQGYLDDFEGRLRKARRLASPSDSPHTVSFTHTIKRGAGMVKTEIEREISEDEFDRLWPGTQGRRLRKTRYRIRDDDLVWEIDDFREWKLAMAEVELPRPDHPVRIPAWLEPLIVREVTDDPNYTNARLALRGVAGHW